MDKQLTNAAENTDHYQSLISLYQQSLFRQAFDSAVEQFGDITQWSDPSLQLLGARILAQLGLYRKSDALIYALWRRHPQLPELATYYVSTVHRWKGPLQALNTITSIRQHHTLSPHDHAHLLVDESSIYAHYRDYSAAEACLRKVPEQEQDDWIDYCFADLQFQQDEYDNALKMIDQILIRTPTLRSAIQKKVQLLQLLGRTDEAIAASQVFWDQCESWWAGKQHFELLLDKKSFQEAEQCLERLESLPPLQGKEITQRHKLMRADLLCAQENYEAALPFLETKSFFHAKIKQSIEQAKDSSARRVLDVPFVRQAHMTCAPASLCAVSRYWGRDEDQMAIVEAICYGGTQSFDERKWAVEKGWFCCEFDLRFTTLKSLIDVGVPVLLSTVEPGSAHLQIIVGYDEKMGTYLLRDPYHPRLQEFLITECEKYYAADGPRCMVIAPTERDAELRALNLPARSNYDLLYKLIAALEKNDRNTAKQCVDYAQQHAPSHRLTIVCTRTLAMYDRDEATILATTEDMLTRFPDNINYQLSKVASLQELGPRKDALTYLDSLASQAHSHFLIRSRLADEIRWDHREQHRTEKLYRELLRISPIHAKTLYGYAGTLWDKGEYQRSYQLYRFCACLEDTHEGYAESFFKAARYHKETDSALDFLKDRYQRFGSRSSGPAISLFNALDSVERTNDALSILDEAITRRPDDAYLLLFAARKQLYLNRTERALNLLKQAKPLASPVRFNETAIEIFGALLKPEKAKQACLAILAIEPLNYFSNNSLARILTEEGNRKAALDHLHGQLKRFPGNDTLQRFIIEWTDPSDKDALLTAFHDYTQVHSNDTWGLRGLANTFSDIQRFESALAAALEAVKIRDSEWANHGCLGDIYLALNKPQLARDAYKRAISLSCDYIYAYSRLLDTTSDLAEQKEHLEFIYKELMNQVSYGQGILEFQLVAKPYFEADRIQAFLHHAVDIRPDLWQSWVALVIDLREQNRCEEALETIERAIQRFPLLPRVHFEKAETLRLLHREDDAIAALQHTLELSPGWTWASNNLCTLYENKGDLEAAVKLQEEAIRRSPLSASPYGLLADLLQRLDRHEEAIAAIEKALDRDINYGWAWRKYTELKGAKNEADQVLNKLRDAIKHWPENADLLTTFTDLSGESDEAEALIKRYLDLHPHHINLVTKLIHIYARQGRFDVAQHYTDSEYWEGNRPIAIEANEAWLAYCQDNLTAALQKMEAVVAKSPNYYDAWRFLAKWYREVNNKQALERAVEHCARLYPHDSNVLCYCAEQLEAVAGDPKKIEHYLRRAFELDTTNQYIGLTYIDFVLKLDRLDDASHAIELLMHHSRNPYVYLRCLELAIKQKDRDTALDYFQRCTTASGESNNIIAHMWRSMEQHNLSTPGANIIRDQMNASVEINPFSGHCLARFDLNDKSIRKVEAQLVKYDFTQPFYQRYLESYLRHLIDKKRMIPKKVETKIGQAIKADALNWGLTGYLKFILNGHENESALFFDGLEQCADAQAWTLYYGSIACRWTGRWHKGIEMMSAAHAKPADNYRGDILIWKIIDELLAHRDVDCAPLAHLHANQLEPMSGYALATAKALAALRGTDFVTSYDQLSPLLRDCQHYIQAQSRNSALLILKTKLKNAYRSSMPELPLIKKLLWRWRLSNHF